MRKYGKLYTMITVIYNYTGNRLLGLGVDYLQCHSEGGHFGNDYCTIIGHHDPPLYTGVELGVPFKVGFCLGNTTTAT